MRPFAAGEAGRQLGVSDDSMASSEAEQPGAVARDRQHCARSATRRRFLRSSRPPTFVNSAMSSPSGAAELLLDREGLAFAEHECAR